jgi:hypothetical protein
MARITVENGEETARRMLRLAYDASRAVGMGFLAARDRVTDAELWTDATYARPDGVNADYLFGRMMKLRFTFGPDWVDGSDGAYSRDYQSFAGKYPDFASLAAAAGATVAA